MGNKFGNFATAEAAQEAILSDGFARSTDGRFTKKCRTGDNLIEQPRKITAIVEISSYRVDGKWAADGKDYFVYQHHFI